jgi:hypothetical protein
MPQKKSDLPPAGESSVRALHREEWEQYVKCARGEQNILRRMPFLLASFAVIRLSIDCRGGIAGYRSIR